jgi:hypothetical protein
VKHLIADIDSDDDIPHEGARSMSAIIIDRSADGANSRDITGMNERSVL